MATHNVGARYFSTFLMTTGYASGFVVLAWISDTIFYPSEKRAVAIGFINACGNVGSIPGTYIWRSMYGPYYRVPFGACLAILGGVVVVAVGLRGYLMKLNGELDRIEGEGMELDDKDGNDRGDGGGRAFRYLY